MILAIETSCDETAVAVFDPLKGIVGEWVHSQIALHAGYGGVVPDLATREHLRTVGPLLALAQAARAGAPLEAVAVTQGPGLAACLAIGLSSAKALAMAERCPVIGVNHLRGHAWSPFMGLHASDPEGFGRARDLLLPHLGLIVSGGNTLLFSLGLDLSVSVISSTRDDAAGEALDKGAKLLGLGYPGGPLVEQEARKGNPRAFEFPRGIARRGELDFSFSGLKTALRYRVEALGQSEVRVRMADLCASYQAAVVDSLTAKTRQALQGGDYRSVGLSGGVANNLTLRRELAAVVGRSGRPLLVAEPRHTGDNAAMIAFAAWADPKGTDRDSGLGLAIEPAAPLSPTCSRA